MRIYALIPIITYKIIIKLNHNITISQIINGKNNHLISKHLKF